MASTNFAAVASTNPPKFTFENIPLPKPEPHQVLVKISHVAQNPTDVQSFDNGALGSGAVYGCDFSGEVIEVGSSVTRLQKGDIIAALIWGGEIPGLGAYSQYTVADEKIAFKIPEGTGRDAAATIPLAAATAWLALFSRTALAMPRGPGSEKKQNVLVWGGSSSVGQYAIQLAKLEGLDVITTCSPKNFDLVRSLGADHVFDYNSINIAKEIQSAGEVDYVFDTIGTEQSSELSSLAIASNGSLAGFDIKGKGKLCTVRPGKAMTEKVVKGTEITDVLVWTVFLKEHKYKDFHWPASLDDHTLGAELFERIPGLLREGRLKPNKVLESKGLESIEKGFELHRQKAISAQKIVYEL